MGRHPIRISGNHWSALLLAAALLTNAGMVACSRSDATVQEALQQDLALDAITSRTQLAVTVIDGVAHIKGETDTLPQQQRAVDIARAVKGVKEVRNEMHLTDTALVEQVRKAIAADAAVSQVPLRIEVQDAAVTLYSDQTNANQRARLKELVAGVPGVARVEDKMK
jgi:osmotically-inducible protein OsmY